MSQPSYALQVLMLPVSIINQVISFHETEPDFVLSLYKAFLYLDDGWYKTRILEHLVNIAWADIKLEIDIDDFSLTDREVMYVYDVLFGDIDTMLYGNEQDDCEFGLKQIKHKLHIDNEFLDCINLIGTLNVKQCFEIDMSGFIGGLSHKYLRLLEEAIISKSENLLKCIKYNFYDEWMCLYLFIQQTHRVYKNPSFEATDEQLFQLISDANMSIICLVLRAAISGERQQTVWNNHSANNVSNPNLEMVKKIVPAIIPYAHRLFEVCYNLDMDADAEDIEYVTPFEYWKHFENESIDYRDSSSSNSIYMERDEAIGQYLKAARPMTWNPDLQQMAMLSA